MKNRATRLSASEQRMLDDAESQRRMDIRKAYKERLSIDAVTAEWSRIHERAEKIRQPRVTAELRHFEPESTIDEVTARKIRKRRRKWFLHQIRKHNAWQTAKTLPCEQEKSGHAWRVIPDMDEYMRQEIKPPIESLDDLMEAAKCVKPHLLDSSFGVTGKPALMREISHLMDKMERFGIMDATGRIHVFNPCEVAFSNFQTIKCALPVL